MLTTLLVVRYNLYVVGQVALARQPVVGQVALDRELLTRYSRGTIHACCHVQYMTQVSMIFTLWTIEVHTMFSNLSVSHK